MKVILLIGTIVVGLIPGLFLISYIISLFCDTFETKPNQMDLVGVYHVVETTNLDMDPKTYKQYKLELKKDSTFVLSPTPNIGVCDSGRYELDYNPKGNELIINCPNLTSDFSAEIERNFGSFRIEFIITDPHVGQSIFFKKDK